MRVCYLCNKNNMNIREHATTQRERSLTGARGIRDERDDDSHQESVMGGGASAPKGSAGNVRGAPPTVLGGAEFMQGVFTAIKQMGTLFNGGRPLRRIKKWKPFKKAFLDQYFTEMANEALRMEFIKLVQGSKIVAQYEAKFTSLSRGSRGSRNKGDNPTGKHRDIHRLGGTYLLLVWSDCSHCASMCTKSEQSGSYEIAITYLVSSGLKGHSSIYINTNFISVQTTSCSSAGSKDSGQVYAIASVAGPSGTVRQ
ncbi:hypothetical protein Acr_00g0004760 [Actinidia rufa]|uniref:Retrotransposon gag domain-containing protein n=1 Tax=Actinidia rufa TaxID=165716 RepID=A0A7J0D7I5_9ERIC|nr:hypothetical protein Acr_00g0004760 [Actinidia rufa]